MRSAWAVAGLVSVLLAPASAVSQAPAGDEWLSRPVDDRTFRTFLDFFSYSHDPPFDTRLVADQEIDGIRVEHLTFQSTPGQRVTALLYQPAMPEGRGVVLLHGGTPAGKDGAYVKLFSTLIARAGFVVLSIDMQYFGERATELLKTFTEQEKHERLYNQPSTYLAWVAQTVKDAGRSLDFLVTERGLAPQRIGLVGISRGAQMGMIVVGADRRFSAAALLMGGHFDAVETGHLPAACPANYIGRISPRPLFLLNAENDADYRKDISVLPLHRIAGEPKRVHWTPGGHGSFTDDDRTALVTWLRANLR